jgi:peptidoglycan hydrolase CwlO-like protein
MKKVFSFAVAALMTLSLAAQTVTESIATVGGLTVPAASVTIQKDPKMVQDAMIQYLKDAKLKPQKDDQGYYMCANAFIEEIAITDINFYTKVESQGKKKSPEALVTVCALSSNIAMNDPATLRDNAKRWLAGFTSYVSRYEAQQQMIAEQGNLKKAEKEAAKAAAGVAAIDKTIAKKQQKIADKEKEIKKLQQKIKDCEKDIKSLQSDIEKAQGKRGDAEKKVQAANQNVDNVQGEVDRYRQMSE